MSRGIWFSIACNEAAAALGGYEKIDASLDAFWDALEREPHGFPSIKTQLFSAKFILTKPARDVPALVWLFTIAVNGDVTLEHVELFEAY